MGFKVGCFVGFIYPPEKNLLVQQSYIDELVCLPTLRRIIKETGSKVGCFAGFCHYSVMITSAHTHAYHYPLFKSGTKTDRQMITCTIHKSKVGAKSFFSSWMPATRRQLVAQS